MNLRAAANSATSAVNPNVLVTMRRQDGTYVTNAAYKSTPNFVDTAGVEVQIQNLEADELSQLDGMNIQGEKRKLYLNGDWRGIIRADSRGGDRVIMADGSEWLVIQVLDTWPDWTSAAILRQSPNGTPP